MMLPRACHGLAGALEPNLNAHSGVGCARRRPDALPCKTQADELPIFLELCTVRTQAIRIVLHQNCADFLRGSDRGESLFFNIARLPELAKYYMEAEMEVIWRPHPYLVQRQSRPSAGNFDAECKR